MVRTIALAAVAVVALAGGVAQAQTTGSSTTRSTTTTTTDGTTTRTVTRSTTTGVTVGVDGEKVGAALGQALVDRLDPEQARIRRLAEPARTEDAFGAWRVTDGGRDAGDCRLDLGEKAGFLGVRPATATGCPGRLSQMGKWRVQTGELVFYTNAGAELRRLKFVEGRFVGAGIEMTRLPAD
ncbi:MAG: AprI/Inh family metalloprotease inhibitor [Caulobacter sp.]|nr:AprI/Inh family metalloprotease inhibitor [Caulobacter sp.]